MLVSGWLLDLGSHSGVAEDSSLLGFYVALIGE
jgi:hypothetical protein